MMQHIILVDPDRTRLQRITHPNRRIQITRVHGGGKAVGGDVAETDGVGLVFELRDAADGAEDLLAHDLHVFADVAEDGGFDEVARGAVAGAADFDFCAFFFAGVDVSVWCGG